MSQIMDVTPQSLKASLHKRGVWREDSFSLIAVEMFKCRPSLSLYHGIPHSNDYAMLVDMACQFADAMNCPWMKTKLKHIVWTDIKGFYDVLASLVHDGKKHLPFEEHDLSLFTAVAEIWAKVGCFPDDGRDAITANVQHRRQKMKNLIDSL